MFDNKSYGLKLICLRDLTGKIKESNPVSTVYNIAELLCLLPVLQNRTTHQCCVGKDEKLIFAHLYR